MASDTDIHKINVFNRTDGGWGYRLSGAVVEILDASQSVVWSETMPESMGTVYQWSRDTCDGTGNEEYSEVSCETQICSVAACGLPGGAVGHYAFENPGDLGQSSVGNHASDTGVTWNRRAIQDLATPILFPSLRLFILCNNPMVRPCRLP